MNATNWRRAGDEYTIEWGGCGWALDASEGWVGLRSTTTTGRRLALSGLAATGRREDGVFRPDDLVGLELLHGRVMATYAPRGWHGLTVRAAWGPSLNGSGIDLEVQASTLSVGELRKLEIMVESTLTEATSADSTTVEPRDRVAASLSYDGREPAETLARLVTAPAPAPESNDRPFGPLAVSTGASASYLEMAHPHDASRRIVEATSDRSAVSAIRCALFGHDLEKGVVLRGRIRGVWLMTARLDRSAIVEQYRRFLDEPPPLGE